MRSRRLRCRRSVAALSAALLVAASAAVAGSSVGAGDGRSADTVATGVEESSAPADDRRATASNPPPRPPRVEWRDSKSTGLPHAGRLERGVKLPATGGGFFTWDPIQKESPNRGWRRWGSDELVRTALRVVRAHAAAHPNAPRVGIGDLSRPRGGDFGPAYGLPGHASHQNGLDADLYYPRLDRRERAPTAVSQVDLRLSQDLVDRFVAAGAEKVFVGPSIPLEGPPDVVVPLANHDNHLHVRLPA